MNDGGSTQAAARYTDSRPTSSPYVTFPGNVVERLPFVPVFSYSWNLRYTLPLSASLSGYAQFEFAHEGDRWNDLHVAGSNGLGRILQPSFSISNLRIGLTPADGRRLAEVYVRNLTARNAIIYRYTGHFDLRETTNEPRVVCVRLSYRFGR